MTNILFRRPRLGFLLVGVALAGTIGGIPLRAVGENPDGEVETEIGGQYRVMANTSTFPWHPETLGRKKDSHGWFNQRFRTRLDLRSSEEVGGRLEAEIGHITWGEDREAPKKYGTDEVGIELRHGYLTWRREGIADLRIGIHDCRRNPLNRS